MEQQLQADGRAKNFSLTLLAGGRYQQTPLYDILFVYPIQGRGPNRLNARASRLGMAVESRNRHCLLRDIHRWHWVAMAESLGPVDGAEPIIAGIIERTPAILDAMENRLPEHFPTALFASVKAGMTAAVKRLASESGKRSISRDSG